MPHKRRSRSSDRSPAPGRVSLAGRTVVGRASRTGVPARRQGPPGRERAAEALLRRERYLAAVVDVQRVLLGTRDDADRYGPILEAIGRASGASRVYVFENHTSPDGEILTSQRAEWCAERITPQIDNEELQNVSLVAAGFQRWLDVLSRGDVITGPISEFPETERAVLEPQSILSILVLPLLVHGEFFGFIGFDSCLEVRRWELTEVHFLRAAAAAISLAEERSRAEEKLRMSLRETEIARDRAEHHARLLKIQALELEQARDGALESARAKSTFLANMSHEIRTPMTAVIGATELFLDTVLTPEQREYALMAQKSAESLLEIINDILDFSKIEAGQSALDRVAFDLREIIEDVAGLLAPRAEEKGIEVICTVPPTFPERVIGDPGRVRQVLVNLVGNAVKFTERGEVRIDTELLERSASGARVRLCVTDTGIGIPADRHVAIFDSFTQGDGSTTRRYGGTGLGLAITRQLTDLMGGSIRLESVPGMGSRFCVELRFEVPLDAAAAVPAEERDSFRPPTFECKDAAPLAGARILLAEDNAANAQIVLRMIEKWGCRAHAVCNGAEAIEAVTRESFDAVLLDVQMPVLDGMVAAREIRRRQAASGTHTPLIAMTAHSMKGDRERCLSAGMDDYLAKPVRSADLLRALARWLGRSGAEQAQAAPAEAPRAARRSAASVFDANRLRETMPDDSAFRSRMVRELVRSIHERLTRLEGALASGEKVEAEREAHALKGVSATVGGDALAAVSLRLEELARTGRLAEAALHVRRARREFRLLRRALRDYLEQKHAA